MKRRFDHVDLRVRHLAEVRDFYEILLPALGFERDAKVEGWLQYESLDAENRVSDFFGVTESPGHVPNENRIAFWADGVEEVDRIATVAIHAGACNVVGPDYEAPGYYAMFFEDPSGNRLEICHRKE